MPGAPADLSPAEKALQLLMPGFKFGLDDPADAERLVALGVGGFCLYGGTPGEIAEFCRRTQAKAKVPLLMSGDYEDGLASHVPGGTPFPSNMGLGAAGSEALAREKGRLTAIESRAIGVRWVFAPVLDLATCPDNPIVNTRSFGPEPGAVARMGAAYMSGVREGGCLSCAKHFPGHGETREDSHLSLPVVDVAVDTLERRELEAFRGCLQAADSVMLAHLLVPGLGDAAKIPVSLSKDGIKLLRERLGFTGLVATDALSMNSIAETWSDSDASAMAISAGADIVLVPAKPVDLAYAWPSRVEEDPGLAAAVEAAWGRLERAKAAAGLWADGGVPKEADLGLVGCADHMKAAEAMAGACLAWSGSPPPAPLAAGPIGYLEAEAVSPDDWEGSDFVAELRRLGFDVKPAGAAGAQAVIAASFVRPRAYSGRIRLTEEEASRLRSAFGAARDSAFVSFGSPYVLEEAPGWRRGLAAFSPWPASQRAAARCLAGRLKAAGRRPEAATARPASSSSPSERRHSGAPPR